MKKKIIFSIIALLLIFSSVVFANDTDVKIIDSDLYGAKKNDYVLGHEVSGNVFNVSNTFELSTSSIVNGDVFLVAKNVVFKSDVTYTDALSKDNKPSIDRINAAAIVNGNVYVVCNEFTLEPGVEINGDLYIVAKSINIQKSSVIHGNIFATCEDFALNGRVENSVYASASSFSTNYFGSIYRDLNLSANFVNINSVIRRSAKIVAKSTITGYDFLIYGNLDVNSESLDFSGEVYGNANFSSKTLAFVNNKDDVSVKCLIKGDLNYSSEKELENVESFVEGAVIHSTYKESKNIEPKFKFKDFILGLLTFTLYIFVIAWLFTLLNKKYINKKAEMKVGKAFAELGIGLLTFLVVIIAAILLFAINIGVVLSFTLISAYIFLMLLATPLFVLDIAILLKDKLNIYLGILLVSLALFVVYQIPYLGGLIMFLFMFIGLGRIIKKILHCA